MQELIKISKHKVGNSFVKTISARELYQELGLSKTNFSKWIKVNLLDNPFFTENIDFITTRIKYESAKDIIKEIEDYQVTIDTAKHLAMLSKTEKAYNIRNYFIEVEKKFSQQLKKQEKKRISPKDIQEMNELAKELIQLSQTFGLKGNQVILSADKGVRNITGHSPLKLLDEIHLVANEKTKIFSPTQLGKEIGKTAMEMNLLLADIGFQKKVGKMWEVLESGLEFAELLDTNKKHSDGTPVKQIKWQKEVLEKIKIEKSEPTLF